MVNSIRAMDEYFLIVADKNWSRTGYNIIPDRVDN